MTKLPYDFDLLWDIKYEYEVEAIANNEPHSSSASPADLALLYTHLKMDLPECLRKLEYRNVSNPEIQRAWFKYRDSFTGAFSPNVASFVAGWNACKQNKEVTIEGLLPCRFCGGSDIREVPDPQDRYVVCNNPRCVIYDVEMSLEAWQNKIGVGNGIKP